jgi:hypothetical protein
MMKAWLYTDRGKVPSGASLTIEGTRHEYSRADHPTIGGMSINVSMSDEQQKVRKLRCRPCTSGWELEFTLVRELCIDEAASFLETLFYFLMPLDRTSSKSKKSVIGINLTLQHI